jgi:hypothetical protein
LLLEKSDGYKRTTFHYSDRAVSKNLVLAAYAFPILLEIIKGDYPISTPFHCRANDDLQGKPQLVSIL